MKVDFTDTLRINHLELAKIAASIDRKKAEKAEAAKKESA